MGHGGEWDVGEQVSLSPKHPCLSPVQLTSSVGFLLGISQHHEGPSTKNVEDTALPAISDFACAMTIGSEKTSYILMSVHILSLLIYATTF